MNLLCIREAHTTLHHTAATMQDALNELVALRLVTSSRSVVCDIVYVLATSLKSVHTIPCPHRRPKFLPFVREIAQNASRILKIEDYAGMELYAAQNNESIR